MRVKHTRFPDYEISDEGRVFRVSAKDGRGQLKEVFGRILRSGYRQFKLRDANGNACLIRANRLVAEAFLGAPPSLRHHSAHNDGDRLNNAISNLRWATPKENVADLYKHGTKLRGSRMPNASLTEAQLQEVRSSFTGRRGEIAALARRFGTGYSTMNRIVHGLSYSEARA